MLRRTRTPPLLPLQGCLLLRPQLPKVRLEDPPQRLRTHYPDLLRTRYTQLLQPHQPHERVLKDATTTTPPNVMNAGGVNRAEALRNGTTDVISTAITCYELMI